MTIEWQISTLDNGMRVVTTPVPTAQSVSVNVFVAAGSRGEERRTNGLSHFIEHMLFKGTRRRTRLRDEPRRHRHPLPPRRPR